MKRQRGASILFAAVIVILVAVAALAIMALKRTSAGNERSAETTVHLAKIAAALEQFASASARLPCPANPAADTGDAVPASANTVCTFPTGTVPWRTIGLRRADSLDAWGWKISYRVYSGATGLTQAGGASMVDCDTTAPPAPTGATAAGLCKAAHDTSQAQFLAGKGLPVNDFGTNVTDAAYVLISHGPSGLGSYTTAGTQRTPVPTSADETANLSAAGTFVAKAAVTDVSPEAATYFDDVIVYRRLAQFVKNANLVARDWPAAASFTNLSFDSPTVNTAAGNTNTDLGQSTLNFPDATVRALTGAGVAQNASFTTSGGYGGLGTVGGGGGLASNVSEVLRIDFPVKAQRFAVTLNRFGQLTGSTHEEQAQLTFFNDGVQVGSPVTLVACHHDADSDDPAANAPAFGLATFAVNVGSDFNRVDIQALTATGGGSQTSLFYVSQLRTCATATNPCVTTFSTANNLCP